MDINQLIVTIIAGGMLGMLGQGIRIAVGFKKFNEENATKPDNEKEVFSTSRMLISIFIGFVAGAIGLLVKEPGKTNFNTESLVMIMAIGYSGADFIEGVFNTYIKNAIPATNQPANPTPANSSNDQPFTVPDEANFSNPPAQG